jgi:hypothetical protein
MDKKHSKKKNEKISSSIAKKIIKEISLLPKEFAFEKGEPLEEEITKVGKKINNEKFIEFLTPSLESVETLASKKSRAIKSIEQDEEILLSETQDKKKEENKENYVSRASPKEYNLLPPIRERNPEVQAISLQPQRVNFQEVGRTIRTPQMEFFAQDNEMMRIASRGKNEEEKNYSIERVDFTEIGREKRYKLMK